MFAKGTRVEVVASFCQGRQGVIYEAGLDFGRCYVWLDGDDRPIMRKETELREYVAPAPRPATAETANNMQCIACGSYEVTMTMARRGEYNCPRCAAAAREATARQIERLQGSGRLYDYYD
jgi:hypothetical protein